MNISYRFSLMLFVALLLMTSHAAAQTLYSLFDLSILANQHSETIKIAEDDLEIAKKDKSRAISVLIPRATAYGAIKEYKEEDSVAPDSLTYGVKLTQSFTLNGKELIALNVTNKTIESKNFSLEAIRSEYLLQVARAYYGILSAQQYLEIAKSDVTRLETHRAAVQEKLNVGNVTKTDLYRAEAELSKSRTELVVSENRVFKAKAALKKLVEISDTFDLKKENIPGIENYTATLSDIREYALSNRYEIKQARKQLEIAQKTIAYEKSDYWPSVSLEAGYTESRISYETASRDIEYDTEDLYASGELVFTLFDGGLRRAEIHQAAAGKRQAENALLLQRKKIINDSENVFRDYTAAKSTLVNLADELKSSTENFNAVQMQFKYGMADSIDMMDANTLLVSAERRMLDARYTYFLSVLNILYTRGDLTDFLIGMKGS